MGGHQVAFGSASWGLVVILWCKWAARFGLAVSRNSFGNLVWVHLPRWTFAAFEWGNARRKGVSGENGRSSWGASWDFGVFLGFSWAVQRVSILVNSRLTPGCLWWWSGSQSFWLKLRVWFSGKNAGWGLMWCRFWSGKDMLGLQAVAKACRMMLCLVWLAAPLRPPRMFRMVACSSQDWSWESVVFALLNPVDSMVTLSWCSIVPHSCLLVVALLKLKEQHLSARETTPPDSLSPVYFLRRKHQNLPEKPIFHRTPHRSQQIRGCKWSPPWLSGRFSRKTKPGDRCDQNLVAWLGNLPATNPLTFLCQQEIQVLPVNWREPNYLTISQMKGR